MKHFYFKKKLKKVLGVAFAVIGVIILIQVIPLKIWIFILGILLVIVGWTLFRLF